MSRVMGKFCGGGGGWGLYAKTKVQAADQRLCFGLKYRKLSLLPNPEISIL